MLLHTQTQLEVGTHCHLLCWTVTLSLYFQIQT